MPLLKPEPFVDAMVNRFVKKRRPVTFELSRETFHGEGTEYIKLYSRDGTMLGQIAYTKAPDGELLLQTIHVEDWTAESAAVERMLKFLDRQAMRLRVKSMRAELYISDARSTDKIEKMKAYGWKPQDVGRMGQRTSFTLVRKLGRT